MYYAVSSENIVIPIKNVLDGYVNYFNVFYMIVCKEISRA